MSNSSIIIRIETPADYLQVERLTFAAFELFEAEGVPKRDIPNEHFLVRLLREDPAFVPELDFVVERDGEIIGNIMYSRCLSDFTQFTKSLYHSSIFNDRIYSLFCFSLLLLCCQFVLLDITVILPLASA
jgi:hypothetical protein